ncbi:AmmeMemoRadiSam system protein B [Patescibacteria group bacterium]|nr:AmmeMemoRadiSam system protein B [Patescibacteria group bacterium]
MKRSVSLTQKLSTTATILAAVVFVVCLMLFANLASRHISSPSPTPYSLPPTPFTHTDTPAFEHGYLTEDYYKRSIAIADDLPTSSEPPIAAIAAHHLIIADQVGRIFKAFEQSSPKRIVLISPNHFSLGPSAIQTTPGKFTTPFGDVFVDIDAVAELRKNVRLTTIGDLTFEKEHGIASLTPFIAHYFPDVAFLPIALDESLSPQDAWALGEYLATLEDTVVIASIDMVHGEDPESTEIEDRRILSELRDFPDCEDASCIERYRIDSNASLIAIYAYAKAKGASDFKNAYHGTSLEIIPSAPVIDNVSHILGWFY